MPLFINKDRRLVDDIISKALDRLAAAGHTVAVIALKQGIKNKRHLYLRNDLLLSSMVILWPGQGHGSSFRHHGGPEIILAFLEDDRLDQATRFELRKSQIRSCILTGRSLVAMEMVENLATVEPGFSDDQYRSVRINLAIYLAAEGRYSEVLEFICDWPDDVADYVRDVLFKVMPDPTGEDGRNMLNAMSSDEVRAEALATRLKQEQAQNNGSDIVAALHRMRGQPKNVPSFLRRVK